MDSTLTVVVMIGLTVIAYLLHVLLKACGRLDQEAARLTYRVHCLEALMKITPNERRPDDC